MRTAGPRFDVTAFGETMLRLSVPSGERLEDTNHFDVRIGGAETNVCAALASLGRRCAWASALPDSPLGGLVLRRLRAARVDTSAVAMVQGARVGTYFVEFASPPRATRVIYDRADSAFVGLAPDDIDWEHLLDTRVFHTTGITLALGPSSRDLTEAVVAKAREKDVFVSFDVNYRRKLWDAEEAAAAFERILPNVDLLVCGVDDAREVFGASGSPEEVLQGLRKWTAARYVVLTLGGEGLVALHDGEVHRQPAYPSGIVDHLGAGDALTAGVLDGLLDDAFVDGLRRGVGLASLALAQAGDMLVTDRPELDGILERTARRVDR